MSAPSSHKFKLGDLDLNVLTFEKKEDKLVAHTHNRENVHITIIARGSVKFNGTVYKAGAIIDLEEDILHEIIAEEDNSRVVNIRKYYDNENKH